MRKLYVLLFREKMKVIKNKHVTKYYNDNGELHRDGDLPAIERANGTKKWYIDDKLHRENGAAIEWSDGYKKWYIDDYNYTEEVYDFIMRRRRKIYFKYYLNWTDNMLDPYTERGKGFMNRQYDKLLLLS